MGNNSNEIKVVSIKELIEMGLERNKVLEICNRIYEMTDFVCKDYPRYKTWFYQKHLPGTLDVKIGRDIVFTYNKNKDISGTSLIKKDDTEQKICTLFVNPIFRGLGIGTALVEKSIELLGTNKPLITIADYKLLMFEGLIKKYHWEQTQVVTGLYNDRSKELIYNGYLDTQITK
ncbi:MAG: GNAT family N-acetyltransferase [Eubacteriales bacterium]|nr:GNAT family N-acetyltransferase [Eubacteriales bacterium]